jgi:FAD/FMN-containing dehydrogenase
MATRLLELFGAHRDDFSLSATIITDGQDFDDATARFTIFERPTYNASIAAQTESDVQAAVRLATMNNIPFLATSGGHGYSTALGALKGGLHIDLRSLKQIEINTSTVTIGPGVLFADILDPLYNAGREMSKAPALESSTNPASDRELFNGFRHWRYDWWRCWPISDPPRPSH